LAVLHTIVMLKYTQTPRGFVVNFVVIGMMLLMTFTLF